jgi:hypothetical protein
VPVAQLVRVGLKKIILGLQVRLLPGICFQTKQGLC